MNKIAPDSNCHRKNMINSQYSKMSWLYKFLLDVIEKKDFCTQCHCTTCGATEFRATLISKLKIVPKSSIEDMCRDGWKWKKLNPNGY